MYRECTVDLFQGLDDEEPADLRALAASRLGLSPDDVYAVRVARRSLDARRGHPLGYHVRLEVDVGGTRPAPPARRRPGPVARGERIVVVGSGPAGLFAALRLAEAGAAVTLVEQGRDVRGRRRDIARLVRAGELDPASNYCFGEGGAGTFSDGKLYTRTKDRAAVRDVLEILVECGADPAILVESRPHIGSNRLPQVLVALRGRLEALGAEVRFSDGLVDLELDGGRVRGARLRSGVELACDRLVLAIGHSARATFAHLVGARGVAAVPKPFAVGARVEHPQALIDRIQYGAARRHPRLPPAFYHLAATVAAGGRERGVYAFCMCPGGWIVNSSTEAGRLATNGMSLKRRDSPFANAALVVTVEPDDLAGIVGGAGAARGAAPDPLLGVEAQRAIEERAHRLGGGGFVAPAQAVLDLLAGRPTAAPRPSSYRPGVAGADLADALPPFVVEALRRALPIFGRTMRGFAGAEAQLVGVETRTSAPLRLVRDPRTCESASAARLYPCGEGAGYAGGIVSSAIDGLRVADAILASAAAGGA